MKHLESLPAKTPRKTGGSAHGFSHCPSTKYQMRYRDHSNRPIRSCPHPQIQVSWAEKPRVRTDSDLPSPNSSGMMIASSRSHWGGCCRSCTLRRRRGTEEPPRRMHRPAWGPRPTGKAGHRAEPIIGDGEINQGVPRRSTKTEGRGEELTINPKPAAVLFADGRDAAREVGDEGTQISDASCLIDTVSWEDVTSLAASWRSRSFAAASWALSCSTSDSSAGSDGGRAW